MSKSNHILISERIELDQREITIPKGEILYHGTVENFDSRTLRTGVDGVFWTTDDKNIARSYIPRGNAIYSTVNAILNMSDKSSSAELLRKSLGINQELMTKIFRISDPYTKKYISLEKEVSKLKKKWEDSWYRNIGEFSDEEMDEWQHKEDALLKARDDYNKYEFSRMLKMYTIKKLKAMGYNPKDGYTPLKIYTSFNEIYPANYRQRGRVLVVRTERDMKLYNYALSTEGDLTDPSHLKMGLFRNLEKKGYDGVIINDFAQTETHGNYGHVAFGFFQNATKDLFVDRTVRNSTHPKDEEWDY